MVLVPSCVCGSYVVGCGSYVALVSSCVGRLWFLCCRLWFLLIFDYKPFGVFS